ncbi:MAG: hypothetical protein LBQ55_10510 [Treponema sp.]|jgi:hypothetical protein|nr:hypothetical protein [Treponema sp.]
MKRIFPEDGWYIRTVEAENGASGFNVGNYSCRDIQSQGGWYHSEKTTSVQDILIEHGRIPGEVRIGNTDINWIIEKEWVYAALFTFDGEVKNIHADLVLKGVDTFADIYLNGKLVGSHDDMFLRKRIDVSEILAEKNELVIHFHSLQRILRQMEEEYAGRGRKVEGSRLIRKACTDFANFIGNNEVCTCLGLYDEVSIEITEDKAWISGFDAGYTLSHDCTSAIVNLEAQIGMNADVLPDVNVWFTVNDPLGRAVLEKKADIIDGKAFLNEKIEKPLLWWPLNYGEQNLYRIAIRVEHEGRELASEQKRIGFRRITFSENFRFEINGKRLRIWGSNLINIDGVTHFCDPERLGRLMNFAAGGNINILRVWGEQVLMPDIFYDLADEMGILVWQDFYLGGIYSFGIYPDGDDYRIKFRMEVEQLVSRLRTHPSVLLYCGSNELVLAGTCEYEQARGKGFELIFEDAAQICARMDPGRMYIPSSPMGGSYPQDPTGGDIHGYWGNDFEPGIQYPVLFSESCHATAYCRHSMLRFMREDEIWPEGYQDTHVYKTDFSEVEKKGEDKKLCFQNYWRQVSFPETWKRHISGFAASELWNLEQYFSAYDADSILYKYSVCGADFYKNEIERIRRGRPCHEALTKDRICSGYLTWKFNDAFPHINFTLIDYYLEPTAQYYAVKRAYAPLLAGVAVENGRIFLYCVNDSGLDWTGSIVLRIFSRVRNRVERQYNFELKVRADESKVVDCLDWLGSLRREFILHTSLFDTGGKLTGTNIAYLDMERNLSFPDPAISLSWDDGYLTVRTDKYARYVVLSGCDNGDCFGWEFDDNYFDLLPFEVKRIRVTGKHSSGTITAKANYSTHISEIRYPE